MLWFGLFVFRIVCLVWFFGFDCLFVCFGGAFGVRFLMCFLIFLYDFKQKKQVVLPASLLFSAVPGAPSGVTHPQLF